MNRGANLCIWLFRASVLTTRSELSADQSSWMTCPNALMRLPFMPDIVVFSSSMNPSPFTYSSRYRVLDRHWMTEFMKQVLPMFLRPFSPRDFTELDDRPRSYGRSSFVIGDERWTELRVRLLEVPATLLEMDARFRRGDVDRS